MEISKNWFEIDSSGWSRKQAGRPPGHLIREFISNSLDQDSVSRIKVTLIPGMFTIEDDGNGFSNLSSIYTLYMSDKSEKDSSQTRGRFGVGSKELLSIADWAEVDTINARIVFDQNGRTTFKSDRTSGTKISVKVDDWNAEIVQTAFEYLSQIIPPDNVSLVINNTEILSPKMTAEGNACLKTVTIVDGIQKCVTRDTIIIIKELRQHQDVGWIFEMGIPVQDIATPFNIDIQQRIPLNDNRDAVEPDYLDAIYGHALRLVVGSLSKEELLKTWAVSGLTNTSKPTRETWVKTVYPDSSKMAVSSYDMAANDICKVHGYTLIDVDSQPYPIYCALSAILPSSRDVAKQIEESSPESEVELVAADPHGIVTNVVKFLAMQALGHSVSVKFFSKKACSTDFIRLADYNESSNTIRFNVDAGLDLASPLSPKFLSIICHEFAHDKHSYHDQVFCREVERIGGEIAHTCIGNAMYLTSLIKKQRPRK